MKVYVFIALEAALSYQAPEILDPGFDQQWHLHNDLGSDLNVLPLWAREITGKGVNIAVVDDGMEFSHPDLRDNYLEEASYDFVENRFEPSPGPKDGHGTPCAGLVAAGINSHCGVGVAYSSKVAGIRLTAGPSTSVTEARALTHRLDLVDIYSCSWGPPDNGYVVHKLPAVIEGAMEQGVRDGRNKKGSIYVFAAGNGAARGDNCAFDGYANTIYTISVGAYSRENQHAVYSEGCASLMVVAPSSSKKDRIYTTGLGSSCTTSFGGTSAATPMVAGLIALALQHRPELTWRDVQHVLIKSAIPILNTGNFPTYAGRSFNLLSGYGRVDGNRLIEVVDSHRLVSPHTRYFSPTQHVGLTVQKSYASQILITQAMVDSVKLSGLEHVTVVLDIQNAQPQVVLTSPNKFKSLLAPPRKNQTAALKGFKAYHLTTLIHWDEPPVGQWTLTVDNHVKNSSHLPFFQSWSLILSGSVPHPTEPEVFVNHLNRHIEL